MEMAVCMFLAEDGSCAPDSLAVRPSLDVPHLLVLSFAIGHIFLTKHWFSQGDHYGDRGWYCTQLECGA